MTKTMDKVDINGFFLLGISVCTANADGQAAKDIGELWGRFMADEILPQITNRVSDELYCVYTDYESDLTGPYTAILGCKVITLDDIPVGLTSHVVAAGSYVKRIAKGKLPDCVAEAWQQIWDGDMDRKYTADFDVWGAKTQNPDDAEVEIYVAVR
ncbi:GyrI-like domain-containing protein [Mucilaginibacter sp. SP1R1]|uniref:GyrI-like domain-containing protein n=1 Tax=Mucilaginibacter sp. SP1R1 TaxID=2723091 RepID=UPI0017C3F4ED|nr:GyrI-like domain-containing protein [Mucilaginibacter sp. SP1R1]MBB6149209.1 putative transcriptional regulator YdeE [Mucilaginibacter sp. SP1R1]